MPEKHNKGFLLDLINSYREIIKSPYEADSDVEAYNFRSSTDFRAPLQITLMWLKSEESDLQIFFLNHNADFSDQLVDIFGPYDTAIETTFQEIGDALNQDHVFKYIKGNEDESYLRDILERLIRKNYVILKTPPLNKLGSRGLFYKNCFYFIYNGNIFSDSLDNLISFFQLEKKRDHKIIENSRSLPVMDNMEAFLGGFIFPPIWFGDIPNLTAEDNIKGKILNKFIKTIYTGELSGRKIIVKNDGYLGIAFNGAADSIFSETKVISCINILNLLFSVFIIEGIPIKSVQASEFVYTTYLPNRDVLSESYRDSSKSEYLFHKRYEAIALNDFKKRRRIVSLDKLREIANLANQISKNNTLENSLNLLIHSYTNLGKLEINQSFILSWTIIEQHLNYKWDILSKNKNLSANRKKKLKSRDYTASVKTEMLNLFGYISEEDYHIINGLRKDRNAFMHEIIPITLDSAKLSFKLAINYLKARIQD